MVAAWVLSAGAERLTGPAPMHRFRVLRRSTTTEVAFRSAWVVWIADRIRVDESWIRIIGRKDVLQAAVVAFGAPFPVVRSPVRNQSPGEDLR